MPGEMWREVIRGGKETTYGTAVAPTRQFYLRDVSFTKTRASRPHAFATGTRDNVRAHTQGSIEAGGSVSLPMSGDELDEWLSITIKGGVTATTPTGATNTRQRIYTPSDTLDSASFQRNDGGDLQELSGVYGNRLRIVGSTAGDNMATFELFAKDRDDTLAALTGTVTQRVPTFMEGWQTRVYADAFGATPGTTELADFAFSWDITVTGNLGRVYLANGTQVLSRISLGRFEIGGTLVIDSAHASAATELANWLADTKRLVRLAFNGPTNDIETGFNRAVWVDIPGAWTAPDTNQEQQGVRAYSLPLTYVYDTTNAFGFQITTRNARTALW